MKEEIKQPEALQLKYMYDSGDPSAHGNMWKVSVCNELERLHEECEKLKAELVAEAARTASEKLRADQMSRQHSTQAALNKEAREELARISSAKTFTMSMDVPVSIGTLWVEDSGVIDMELCPCATPKLTPGEYTLFAKAAQGRAPEAIDKARGAAGSDDKSAP